MTDRAPADFIAAMVSNRTIERTDRLREAVTDAILEHGMGMTVAQVVGILAVLQHEIIAEWAKEGET
jgi:hypothetical protein